MPQIRIPIHKVLTDPDNPTDLTALPPDQVVERLRELYSFLPTMEDVQVAGDVAVISVAEENPYRVEGAQATHKRAGRVAERGNYQAAREMLQEVLEVIPLQARARRELGMAYMELGDSKQAKQHVVEALRLEPDDAWAYVILGNIYMKMEGNADLAERCYEQAQDLEPTDVFVLNGLAALKAERGKYEEARSLFEQAIEQDPEQPNPRYGLALCYVQEGHLEPVPAILEGICAPPRSRDARSDPVYVQVQALYLDVNRRLARQNQAQMLEQLKQVMDRFAAESGTPIELREDNSIDVFATTQLAWVYKRDRHVIRYKATAPEVLPHRFAHQFELIRLAHHARETGRGRVLVSPPGNKEYALRLLRKDAAELQRQGIGGAALESYLDQLVDGLLRQLNNIPLELFTEHRIYYDLPFLRPSQVVSLHLTHQQGLQVLLDESVQAVTPRLAYDANLAMNCAHALSTDFLFNDATAYAEPYRTLRAYAVGSRLFDLWRERASRFEPDDEYDLVDEFAAVLKLQRWYEWQPVEEPEPAAGADVGPRPEGPTDIESLRQKAPAAVLYLLGALERFDKMDQGEVQQIAFEIAMLGRSGLDYSSPDTKYTLRSIPGEEFSGLQLMAMMYVGFKRIQPNTDLEMPLDEAYALALALHRGER